MTLILTLVLTAVLLTFGPISLWSQIILLAIGVSVIGIPHGAMDHRIAERLLQARIGRLWAPVFALGYLSLVILVVLAWPFNPKGTLIGFLLVSVVHFGLGDTEAIDGSESKMRKYAAAIAYGLLPVGLPIAFHPTGVAMLFNWLMPGNVGFSATAMTAASTALRFAIIPAWLWIFFNAARRRSRLAMCELCVLPAVYILLPPLLGFSIYFCLWHSPRHLIDLAWWRSEDATLHSDHAGIQTSPMAVGFRRLAVEAIPLTLLTLAGIIPTALYLLPSLGANATLVRVIFIALSALTVPHMILTAAAASFPPPRFGTGRSSDRPSPHLTPPSISVPIPFTDVDVAGVNTAGKSSVHPRNWLRSASPPRGVGPSANPIGLTRQHGG